MINNKNIERNYIQAVEGWRRRRMKSSQLRQGGSYVMNATGKLVIVITFLCILFLGVSPNASATQDIKVLIDGKVQVYDQAPFINKGSTLVPLRGIFESLGAQVSYDDKTKTITGKKGSREVILVLGSTKAKLDGKEVTLAQPAQAFSGRTMVPLRFISESLGAGVQWDGTNRQALITTITKTKTQAELITSVLNGYEGMWESDSPDAYYLLWVDPSDDNKGIKIYLGYQSPSYGDGIFSGMVELNSETNGTFDYVREYEETNNTNGVISFKNKTISLTYTDWDKVTRTVTFKKHYPNE
jgi:hypothetical protein